MKVTLNENTHIIEQGLNIKDFLISLGHIEDSTTHLNGKAVALNNKIIPQTLWSETSLQEGSELLLIEAAQGG